jgi:HK97 family phage prohead protease
MEIRAINIDEVKIGKVDEFPVVEGYGIVYDQEVELLPGFFEKVSRKAFTKSLAKRDVIKSYFNHDSEKVLSTTNSNPPLTFRDDEKGLYYISPIPPTTYGEDLKINLQRKNVSGSSFAFIVSDEDWEERKDGTIHRNIREGEIFEIGPVTDPAYVQTGAALRTTKELYESRKRTTEETVNVEKIKKNKIDEDNLAFQTLKLNLEKETV